ncbi:hypothetical protein GCM10010275_34850 [Streptomyces litmocidini]|nr:hypothetical protein GCM10010275_34850 [Streptomyces litmocidini]
METLGERGRLLPHPRGVEEPARTQTCECPGASRTRVSRLLARSPGRLRKGMAGTTAGG